MTEPTVMYIVLIIGFILSYIIYSKYGIRAPGVIAAPLLAIYTLENQTILLIVAIVGTVIYIVSQMLYKKWFIYGRRLFLIMCMISVIITAPIISILGLSTVIFISILPAIFAYNITINGTKITTSIGVLLLEVLILIIIGSII